MSASYLTEHFKEHALSIEHFNETSIDALEKAVDALFMTVLNGHKIFCTGIHFSAQYAKYFCELLLNGLDYPRPSLPAIAITPSQNLATENPVYQLIQQVSALGQSGDVLVIFDNGIELPDLTHLISVTHEREIFVILLTTQQRNVFDHILKEFDIILPISTTHQARLLELQLLLIHCLCDGIDKKLLGQA